NSAFYDLLGSVLMGTKDLSGAETALKKAVELNKNNTDAFAKLGRVQVSRGAPDEAIATYNTALAANPKEAAFYILIGGLYETKERRVGKECRSLGSQY